MCPSESLPMYLGANSLIAVRAMIWISSERPTIHTHSSGISSTYIIFHTASFPNRLKAQPTSPTGPRTPKPPADAAPAGGAMECTKNPTDGSLPHTLSRRADPSSIGSWPTKKRAKRDHKLDCSWSRVRQRTTLTLQHHQHLRRYKG
ncbi:hypothetical protein PGT21_007629 [Puccinia graminis f. sp. tritici]|uniref:Uncharacterized protein n=1 Tax=Puccinia graminis f. sp. tritici TaxID=56615 RepID=A0A5B0QZY0_PUCGR|nr:hypothetical protein PGT21_007629 [Puccinia graminis f. sp. tritici]